MNNCLRYKGRFIKKKVFEQRMKIKDAFKQKKRGNDLLTNVTDTKVCEGMLDLNEKLQKIKKARIEKKEKKKLQPTSYTEIKLNDFQKIETFNHIDRNKIEAEIEEFKTSLELLQSLACFFKKGCKDSTVSKFVSVLETMSEEISNSNSLIAKNDLTLSNLSQKATSRFISTIMPLKDRETYAKFDEMLQEEKMTNAFESFICDEKCVNMEEHVKKVLDKTFSLQLQENIKWFGINEELGIRSSQSIELIIDTINNLYQNCTRSDVEHIMGVYFLENTQNV